MNNYTVQLVLGGARSGKSSLAEQYAQELFNKSNSNTELIYLATATANDQEMQARIDQHQSRRSETWQLIEEPIQVANILKKIPQGATVLVDCLTLWLSNCMHAHCWPEQRREFLELLESNTINLVLVSNEVGSGIVPMGELTRNFVDESGWLHQDIAKISNKVTLVVAGLAMDLKTTELG